METEPDSQASSGLVPAKCYQYIFPESFDLRRISYYFDHQMGNTVTDDIYEELFGRVGAWQAMWNRDRRPYLKYRKSPATVTIFDGRRQPEKVFTYGKEPAALYEFSAEARTPRDIEARFGTASSPHQPLNHFLHNNHILHLAGP